MACFRPSSRWRQFQAAALLLGFMVLATITTPGARAQTVTVNGSLTAISGGFQYDFSITNNTLASLALFSLDLPVNTTLTDITAPAGFFGDYLPDPNLDGTVPARLDFIGEVVAAATVSGFSFRSASSFVPFSITATDVDNQRFASINGVNFPGATILPSIAPEPGSLSLLAFTALPLAATIIIRRPRRAATLPVKG